MAATKTSLTTTENELATRTDNEGLPNLFSRLGDDIMQLFNSQLALFKVEIKEEASAYARAVTIIAIGGVIATVGFALLNVAIAFRRIDSVRSGKFQSACQLRARLCRNGWLLRFGGRGSRNVDEEQACQAGPGTPREQLQN
jgi:uncharacterized membrane protein YqjE